MANRTKLTIKMRKKFLEALAETANVTEAAKEAGISRTAVYEHRTADSEFAAGWKEAEEQAADRLEREALRRGVEGVEEPVFYQGEVCGHIRKYSDRMLEILLKARRPERFKDRVANELTGPEGAPMIVKYEIVPVRPSDVRD